MQAALDQFIQLYSQDLAGKNMSIIADIYSDDIEFIDPAHHVVGIKPLVAYFDNLMSNITLCHFVIHKVLKDEAEAVIIWTMRVAHPKLNKGQAFDVEGSSHLKYSDKIYYHRDYFDLGAMLYEHLPLLGMVLRRLKGSLAA